MDKVRPLKIESTATGGTENDAGPVELDPSEDYVSTKGIAFEENDSRKIDLDVSGNIQFKDATETTPITVNQIKTAYVAPLAAVESQLSSKADLVAGKVPISQLPSALMTYEGVWNASTNSPTLTDGVGNAGEVYRVGTGGTQNLGSGAIVFAVGDYAIYNGSAWEKSDGTDAVNSVNGQVGIVTLNKTDIGLSNADNTADSAKPVSTAQQAALDLKAAVSHVHVAADVTDFTSAAKAAVVNDTAYSATTWDAVADVAPSKNAVRDQFEINIASINGKEPALGNPATNGHVLSSTTAGVRSWSDSGKWTYSIRATDYTGISGTTLATGFCPTPANALAPSKRYELHGKFWLSSSATTNGIKISWTWLGSYTAPVLTGVLRFVGPTAVTAEVLGYTAAAAPVTPVISGTGVPAATTWYLCTFDAIAEIDAASSDARWHLALANELAPSNTCNLKAGSFIRWREII